ncbi:MAG TPA: TatD family hydrolase [Bacteriovoracaceae bacterium]|nr:TatD family hydrolase [Bacteriovoracaceae bacterium]
MCLNIAMSTLPYLDIHTHRRLSVQNSVTVGSLSVDDLTILKTTCDHSTAGIHPWWLEDYTADEITQLQKKIELMVEKQLLWGIGETGLDRSMPELMDLQKGLFLWHMQLAEKNDLPLMIHNVRAGADFLEILKTHKPKGPWIFHDFRGNEQLVQDLLRLHPLCFFSFGLSIDNSPQIRELLPSMPLENLFLETDDQKHLDIHDIHLRAAHHLGVDLEFLKSQVWHNFKKISRTKH